MAMSVSIIVPVYNVEEYITDCFQSIVKQTYTGPMECLFIDDCGTDNSIQVLAGLIKAYDGPIEMRLLHHEKNKGLSGARNTGISNAKGDYLFFLDSDDQLYPFSISSFADAAIKEKMPDVVLGGYQVSVPDHPINQYCYDYEVIDGQPAIAKAFLDDKLFCMAPNKLVRREFIVGNGLYFKEGIIHEDNLWSFQSFHLAQKVVTIPEKTYYYMIHSGSIMTSELYVKKLKSITTIYDVIRNDIEEKRYEQAGKKSMNYIEDILNTRCIRIFDQLYYNKMRRKDRLFILRNMSNELKQIINDYWSPPTRYLRLQKSLFMKGSYRLFDVLMFISILKDHDNPKPTTIENCYSLLESNAS